MQSSSKCIGYGEQREKGQLSRYESVIHSDKGGAHTPSYLSNEQCRIHFVLSAMLATHHQWMNSWELCRLWESLQARIQWKLWDYLNTVCIEPVQWIHLRLHRVNGTEADPCGKSDSKTNTPLYIRLHSSHTYGMCRAVGGRQIHRSRLGIRLYQG